MFTNDYGIDVIVLNQTDACLSLSRILLADTSVSRHLFIEDARTKSMVSLIQCIKHEFFVIYIIRELEVSKLHKQLR